jgi:putative ABC transport system permease protein
MYHIALQMLFGERAKYYAMVMGISFASLIMTQQPAIFVGLLTRTYSFVRDVSLPDIWVMDPGVQYVEEHKPLRDTEIGRVRGIEGVSWAVRMYKNLSRARLPDGNSKNVDITGLDDATLVGAPLQFLAGNIQDFRRTDAVFVDLEAAKTRLQVNKGDGTMRPLAIGDTLEINDKRAIVMGYIKGTRTFTLQSQIYTTYSNAIEFEPPTRRKLTYILVKAKPGVDFRELSHRIQEKTQLKAYTANDFYNANLDYWFKNTGIPINFGISVLMGFIVGAAVAGQTFFNFVQENLKHYAALKAMGLQNKILARMVLLQAMTVGFIGYGIGVGLTTLFGMKFNDSVLAFRMAPSVLVFAFVGVFLIISLAAFLGIRHVTKVDPSVVFRS